MASLLTACSGNNQTDISTAKEIPVTVQVRSLRLDPSLPADLIGKIVSTVSPVDAVSGFATTLQVPIPRDGTPGESMVLAIDANHNILLAGMITAEGTTTELNAASTALVLTRLAWGRLPEQITPASINSAIRATAQWPDLVVKVEKALAAGQSPAKDIAVYDSLLALLPQATLHSQIGPTAQAIDGNRRTAQAALVANPSLTPSNLPHRIVSGISSKLGVFAKAASGDGMEVSNSMSIIWSIGTRDTDNRALCPTGVVSTAANPDCVVLIDRMDTLKQLAYLTDLNLAAPPSVVTGGNGHAFNLSVQQDGMARAANLTAVLKDVIMVAIDGLSAGKSKPVVSDCSKNIADVLLPTTELSALIVSTNSLPVKQYFNDLVSTSAGGIKLVSTLSSCMTFKEIMADKSAQAALAVGGGAIGDNAIQNAINTVDFSASQVFASIWSFTKDLGFYAAGQLGPVTAVINSGGLGVAFGQIIDNWSTVRTVGVCLVNGAVASCATTLHFGPPALVVTLGSALPERPELLALDIAGGPTLLPGDLVYASSQPGVLSVNPATGALAMGSLPAGTKTTTLTITATVVSTGVTGNYTVTVSEQPSAAFTKISAAGSDLSPDAPEWACVRHNTTGLLWEAHVTRRPPAHPCALDATYTCYGYSNFGDGSRYDASTIPATVGNLCGKSGWRLPTETEGRALVNDPAYAASNPATGIFQQLWFGTDDTAAYGWTSSRVVGSAEDFAWSIYFAQVPGFVDAATPYSGSDYSVRLVVGP